MNILDIATIPQNKEYSSLLRIMFRFSYQLVLNKLRQSAFKNNGNYFAQKKLISLFNKDENNHPRYLTLSLSN